MPSLWKFKKYMFQDGFIESLRKSKCLQILHYYKTNTIARCVYSIKTFTLLVFKI